MRQILRVTHTSMQTGRFQGPVAIVRLLATSTVSAVEGPRNGGNPRIVQGSDTHVQGNFAVGSLARCAARATVLDSVDDWVDSPRPHDLTIEPTEPSGAGRATRSDALAWSAPPPDRRDGLGSAGHGAPAPPSEDDPCMLRATGGVQTRFRNCLAEG